MTIEQPTPIPSLEEIGTRLIAPVQEGPPDVIPGLLPRRGQLVIAGETNVGKTLVALEICSSLVTGAPLWGSLLPTLQARRVLYILGEHYNEVVQRLWQVTGLPMSDNVWLIGPEQLGYDKWLVTRGQPNPTAVSKLQRWADGCDLLVFDPFSSFVSGADVENDNIQMRLVLDTISLVAQSVGASCIVLAHQGKPMMDKNGKEQKRTSYAIRGASAIEDAATNIFYMNRRERQENNELIDTADVQGYELVLRKYKGTAPERYLLARDKVNLNHRLLGPRPNVQVKKYVAEAQFSRIAMKCTDMKREEIIKVLAALNNRDEQTITRWLSGED